MSTTTTNYSLIKPELTDAADITAMNANWDAIDSELFKRHRYIGQNPVTTPTDDTVETWRAIGNGFAIYTQNGCLLNQPSQYGFLIQYTAQSDLMQLWMTTMNGPIYYRNGNAKGWWASSSIDDVHWRKLYDDFNKPSASDIGAMPMTVATAEVG